MVNVYSKIETLTGVGRIPYVSLLLGAAALMIHGLGDARRFALRILEPTLFDAVVSHWAHWSDQHLLWSGGAFVLLGAVCERRSRTTMVLLTALSTIAISCLILLIPTSFDSYAGLSGIDSAYFGLLVAQMFRALSARSDRRLAFLPLACGLGFLLKLAYEIVTGQAFFVDGDVSMRAVPSAHIAGFAIGVLFGTRAKL